MPTYIKRCTPCALSFEAFATMKTSHLVRCPQCDGPTHTDIGAQGPPNVPAHDLHGGRMKCADVRASPHEVPELRRLYGDIGHVWGDDGKPRFTKKDEPLKFYKRDEEIRQRFREQKAAKASTAQN